MRKLIDKFTQYSLAIFSSFSLLLTILVVFLLFEESFQFFQKVPVLDFLFGTIWQPLIEPREFGVLPLVAGTFAIVIGAIAIALPLGLMIAIYLSEYASDRTRFWLKPSLEVLAGVPTVVYGYFALNFITPILQVAFPSIHVFNALSASIVVGVMIIPMISSICDDAIRSLPRNLKEAGYAMGANSYEVVADILIPAAKVHIWSAVVLAVSRALGETMAVSLAAGSSPTLFVKPLESLQTMTAYIVQVSLGDVEHGGVEYLTSFAVAALLFLITFAMNIIGYRLVRKAERL